MGSNLIYAYGIIKSDSSGLNLSSISPELQSLHTHNFFVLYTHVSESSFGQQALDRNMKRVEWVEPQVRAHLEMLGTIMEICDILPFKFATVFISKQSLLEKIESSYNELSDKFNRIEGREEWALKVFVDFEVLEKQIEKYSQKFKNLENEIQNSSSGKAYLLKKKKAELIKDEVKAIAQIQVSNLIEQIKPFVKEIVFHNVQSKEITQKDSDMLRNVALLIDKSDKSRVFGIIENWQNDKSKEGFEVICNGPWPPFSFTS